MSTKYMQAIEDLTTCIDLVTGAVAKFDEAVAERTDQGFTPDPMDVGHRLDMSLRKLANGAPAQPTKPKKDRHYKQRTGARRFPPGRMRTLTIGAIKSFNGDPFTVAQCEHAATRLRSGNDPAINRPSLNSTLVDLCNDNLIRRTGLGRYQERLS